MDIFQAQCTMNARNGFIAAPSPAMLQQDDFLFKLQQFRNKPYILSPAQGGQTIFVCSVHRGVQAGMSTLLLIDNGSTRRESTLNLRRLAKALSDNIGRWNWRPG